MPLRRWTIASLLTMFVAGVPAQAMAADGSWTPVAWSAKIGFGNDVDIYGAGARWNLTPRADFFAANQLELRLDLTAAYWRGMGRPTPYGHLWDFGLTPLVRRTWPARGGMQYYVEGGIGPHALTATRINNSRKFGIAFQFGTIVGAGIVFGPRHEYDVGLYFEHVSNARLASDNWGLSYPGVVFRAALP